MRFWILVRGRGRIYIKFIKFLPALFENLFSEVVFYQLLVILILKVLHLKTVTATATTTATITATITATDTPWPRPRTRHAIRP